MAWYAALIICVVMFAAGCAITWLYCKENMNSELSGHLFITKSNNQPFLAASVPIASIAEQKYVTFEVKLVDDSQK